MMIICSVLLAAAGFFGVVSGENVSLNRAGSWSPIGAVPVVVSYDDAENAIRFSAEREEGRSCQIWPLFSVREPGALRRVVAIRFEMKYLPEGGSPTANGAIVLPKLPNYPDKRIVFPIPAPGEWKTIEVKFNRPPDTMILIRSIQILVNSRAERMSVLMRNLALVTDEGTAFDFKPAAKAKVPKTDLRHKLRPQGAPASFSAAPGEKHCYRFRATQLPDGSTHDWIVTGMDGGSTGFSGRAVVRNSILSVELALPAGFHELHFPALEQVFGISVLPPHPGNADSFFAIEGLMETRPAVQENCLNFLARNGILHNREHAHFQVLHPREGEYRDPATRFYRIAGKKGVQSIFFFTLFPAWLDPVANQRGRNVLPGKLIGLDRAIVRMLEERREGDTIMLQRYPVAGEYDPAFIAEFADACETVAGIRNIRQQKNISPKEPLELKVKSGFPEETVPVIEKLANVKVGKASASGETGAGVTFMVRTYEMTVPLTGMVDVAEEIAKLEAVIEYQTRFLESVRKKLGNEKFMAGAPEKVVAMEKKKEADSIAKIEAARASIRTLKGEQD